MIRISKIDNRTTIELYKNGIEVGFLYIDECIGYDWFEGHVDEAVYESVTTDDNYLVLEMLYIDQNYRNKGLANELMVELEKLLRTRFNHYGKIFLWADPFEMNIPLPLLKSFYAKYGFKEIKSPNAKEYIIDIMQKNLN